MSSELDVYDALSKLLKDKLADKVISINSSISDPQNRLDPEKTANFEFTVIRGRQDVDDKESVISIIIGVGTNVIGDFYQYEVEVHAVAPLNYQIELPNKKKLGKLYSQELFRLIYATAVRDVIRESNLSTLILPITEPSPIEDGFTPSQVVTTTIVI